MILFLDFDGVLHPIDRSGGIFTHLMNFESVVRDFSDVDIVISSAWREGHDLTKLRSFFSEDIARRIIDVTPVLNHLDHRYLREAEILFWLRECGREYEGWIAIDDSEWLFTPGCRNLILVDTNSGLSQSVEKKLRARLSGK